MLHSSMNVCTHPCVPACEDRACVGRSHGIVAPCLPAGQETQGWWLSTSHSYSHTQRGNTHTHTYVYMYIHSHAHQLAQARSTKKDSTETKLPHASFNHRRKAHNLQRGMTMSLNTLTKICVSGGWNEWGLCGVTAIVGCMYRRGGCDCSGPAETVLGGCVLETLC